MIETKENLKKMRILFGESMGGAVALLLHRKKPEYWDGAVLVAPMCKVRVITFLHQTNHQIYDLLQRIVIIIGASVPKTTELFFFLRILYYLNNFMLIL